MKILIAVDHFKDGGAERVASIIINQLAKEQDLNVVVFESEANYSLEKDIFQLHVVDYKRNANPIVRQLGKLIGFRKIIKSVRPDVILSFGYYMSVMSYFALLWNGRQFTKFITSERTDPSREPGNVWYEKLRTCVYGHSDLLICQTEWVKSFFSTRIQTSMVVIPNPITPNLPQWEGKNSHIILAACRLMPQKNLTMLLESFAIVNKKYPEYKLRILGDGPLKQNLEKLSVKLGLINSLEMPGFSKNVHDEMTKCYMYVSSSDYEGISNSMLEALGCGVPTICTDCPVGGASMFIRHEDNGLLTPVGDSAALAGAMMRFIEDKEFAVRCGRNATKINGEIDASTIGTIWANNITR